MEEQGGEGVEYPCRRCLLREPCLRERVTQQSWETGRVDAVIQAKVAAQAIIKHKLILEVVLLYQNWI